MCRVEVYGPKADATEALLGSAVGTKLVMTETKGDHVPGRPWIETGAYCPACKLLPDSNNGCYILPVVAPALFETDDNAETDTNLVDPCTDIHCLLGVGG